MGMLNKRMGRTEKITSKLEDRTIEITQSEQRENGLENKGRGAGEQSLWDYNKTQHLCHWRSRKTGERSRAEKASLDNG